MWSDNESDVDLLQYRYLAAAVARIVTDRELTPSTVGLFGDWGSGKSTLLKMIDEQLKSRESVISLAFNGWLFEDYNDAKTALLGAILDRIAEEFVLKKGVSEKAKGLLKRLAARVNWLHLLAMSGAATLPTLAGHPAATPAAMAAASAITQSATGEHDEDEQLKITAEDLEKLVKDAPEKIRRSIRDFRRDFEGLLKEAGINTLVVFIDDLDRCLPDTIIETLEAIKLFLFVQGSAFVLAADPRIVQYAVRTRFPELPGEEVQVGRDYLEKLIQFPVSVPPLNGPEIESYMNLLFARKRLPKASFVTTCEHIATFQPSKVAEHSFDAEVCREILKGNPVPLALEEDFDLVLQIAPVLTRGLSGSPRRTKRFLNTLLFRIELAKDRGLTLNRAVLAKLMLLEYFRDEYFRQLARLQAAQSGRPSELAAAEAHARQADDDKEESQTGKQDTPGSSPKTVSKDQEATRKVELTAEAETWIGDPWMEEWLRSDPALGEVNLQPYFYITREKASDLDSPLRLSPHAAEILRRLLEGGVSEAGALKETKNLSEADATALFQNLSQRVRKSQTLDAIAKLLFKLMPHRPDLIPQLIALLGSLPETKITLAAPFQLWQAVKGSGNEVAARAVLERWAKSQSGNLAAAAKQALKHIDAT